MIATITAVTLNLILPEEETQEAEEVQGEDGADECVIVTGDGCIKIVLKKMQEEVSFLPAFFINYSEVLPNHTSANCAWYSCS